MKPIFTAVISGITYLLHPQVLGTIQEDINPDTVLPVTLLKTEEIFSDDLDGLLKLFEQIDDVYSDAFAFALVEKPSDDSKKRAVDRLVKSDSVNQTYTIQESVPPPGGAAAAGSPFADLPSGPYILHGKSLHQAYRVYEDTLDAFTVGILPGKKENNDVFLDLSETLKDDVSKPIAVPSRLYFPAPSVKKPLSGIRFAIPENLNVKGVPTTVSSTNWTSLNPDGAESMSDYAKHLLDQGAILVGKTKSGQFASAEEWTATESPGNPRGDGKQPPGGAASGAASAMTGYDWLAYSIGDGAIHGVQDVAAAYGVFSLRATAGLVSQGGLQASSPKFASFGMSSRNLNDFIHTAAPALDLALTSNLRPKRVIYPTDFFPLSSAKEQSLTEEFVTALEKYAGVKVEKISLADTWAKKIPCKAKGKSLDEYLGTAVFRAFCYDFYHNYDEFRTHFDAKFGEEPFVEATTKFQWNIGKNVTKEEYEEYLARITLFNKWFNTHITSTASSSQDHAVVVLPIKSQSSSEVTEPKGLRSEQLAAILGTPQMTAPFAQLPMDGNGEAYLPFSASVIGPKGDDLMLVQLMKRTFDIVDWRIRVDTGSMTYPLGTNSRNVDDHKQDPVPDPGPGAFAASEDDSDSEL